MCWHYQVWIKFIYWFGIESYSTLARNMSYTKYTQLFTSAGVWLCELRKHIDGGMGYNKQETTHFYGYICWWIVQWRISNIFIHIQLNTPNSICFLIQSWINIKPLFGREDIQDTSNFQIFTQQFNVLLHGIFIWRSCLLWRNCLTLTMKLLLLDLKTEWLPDLSLFRIWSRELPVIPNMLQNVGW